MASKFGDIFFNKVLIEYQKYPHEKERDFMMDILFESLIRMKTATVEWISNALAISVPENILSDVEK
jgi:hypothetical protein